MLLIRAQSLPHVHKGKKKILNLAKNSSPVVATGYFSRPTFCYLPSRHAELSLVLGNPNGFLGVCVLDF